MWRLSVWFFTASTRRNQIRCYGLQLGWSLRLRLLRRRLLLLLLLLLLLRDLVLAIGDPGFYLRAFFVVVPCREHHEGHGTFGIIVAMKLLESIFEGLTAAAVHATIQAP